MAKDTENRGDNIDVTEQVTEALALLNNLPDERHLDALDQEKLEQARTLLASIL